MKAVEYDFCIRKKLFSKLIIGTKHIHGCLLYTSDAADERSSVDLGGRRIIKKKNNIYLNCGRNDQ